MMVAFANVGCPKCGAELRHIGDEVFRCLRCSELLEQSPSAGWRAVESVMGIRGGGYE